MEDEPQPFDLLTTQHRDEPMARIWSQEGSISRWLATEAELARAQADVGVILPEHAEEIAAACAADAIDPGRLWHEARNVGYPILPLIRQITAVLPPGPDGRVHYGATTQDIMDTALALQLGDSCRRLEDLLVGFGDALARLVEEHASTVMAARTHAQHAVPTTFGAKTAVFLDEVRQELLRVRTIGTQVRVVSLFGAGGTSAAMGESSARVRAGLANRLGLADCSVPWHVARGNVLGFALGAASVASLCTRFAREIVDLSRSEIGEVREPIGPHRGASSTMPQKTNPISSETVIGLAVNAATLATALLRAREAGHERAAGEWQIEWFALPHVSIMTASALALSAQIAGALHVSPDAMRRNLDVESGRIMSEAVMMRLAPQAGRERAHDLVYAAAERGRTTGETLTVALHHTLPADLIDVIGSIEPGDYTGEAEQICAAATHAWAAVRTTQAQGEERP